MIVQCFRKGNLKKVYHPWVVDELCSLTTANCSLVSKPKINLVCFEEKFHFA